MLFKKQIFQPQVHHRFFLPVPQKSFFVPLPCFFEKETVVMNSHPVQIDQPESFIVPDQVGSLHIAVTDSLPPKDVKKVFQGFAHADRRFPITVASQKVTDVFPRNIFGDQPGTAAQQPLTLFN